MTDADTSRETRDAVADVLVRYATGIDSRDWALFRTCFTDDCDVDYGEIGHWHGRDEVTTWMAETHEPIGPTLHRISNITVRQDGDRVTARSYVHAILVLSDRSAIHAYGRYDDVLVGPDAPTIARRRFTTVTTELHAPTA